MIKKTLLLSSLVLAVVLLSGCGKKTAEQNAGNKETAQKEETGGVITSIKDAIGLGKKMQCTYTYKEGEESFTSTTYVEGEKYKGESEIMGKKQIMVFDGNTMYSWSEADKKGTKWDKKCMEELNKDSKKTTEESSDASALTGEELADASEVFDDALDTKCVPVASIDFSVPSDITFSDMCEQLKKMQDAAKNLPSGIDLPEGVNIPSL